MAARRRGSLAAYIHGGGAMMLPARRAQDAGTEQLRIALRGYRTFWTSVTQLP